MLNWTGHPNSGTRTAQLTDRKYVVTSDISYRLGVATVQWNAGLTMTPGPYIFLVRGIATRDEAIELCEKHAAAQDNTEARVSA